MKTYSSNEIYTLIRNADCLEDILVIGDYIADNFTGNERWCYQCVLMIRSEQFV